MWQEAALTGAGIVGGDLVQRPQWVVSVTVLGDLGGRAPVRRGGAQARRRGGRRGELGRSAAGYALWRQRRLADSTSCAAVIWCRSRRTGRAGVAAEAGATAMTDVSDGLLADLGHIATASGVGVDLSLAGLGRRSRRGGTRPAPRSAPTRGSGCSAAARITRWSRRSPVRRRPAGG